MFFICFSYSSFSQSFDYRKYNYEWKYAKPEEMILDKIYSNEDAVILEEKCIYNITGNLVQSYSTLNAIGNYFYIDESSQGKSPIVQKYVRIKFLTQKGIDSENSFFGTERVVDQLKLHPSWPNITK